MASRGRRRRGEQRLRMVGEPQLEQDEDPDTQELVENLREVLRTGDPLDLLALVSTMQHVMESGLVLEGEAAPDLGLFIDTLIGHDTAETTASLHALSALVTDDDLRGRIDAALATRRQPMPIWLRDLTETRITRAIEMSETLGDGDDILLAIRWADEREATYVIYIDHNAGTLVKDAFPAAGPITEVAEQLRELSPGEGLVHFRDVELGEARAIVEAAMDLGELLRDPYETETWPLGRPLLRWLLRLMPDDGPRAALDPGAMETLAAAHQIANETAEMLGEFILSSEADELDLDSPEASADGMCLLAIAGFASQDSGDVLRWSPTRVELLFGIWLARTLVDATVARRMPHVARAFIAWSMKRRDLPPRAIRETLGVLDAWASDFVTLATSHEAVNLRRAVETYEHRVGEPDILGIGILEDPRAGTWGGLAATQAALDAEYLERCGQDAGSLDVLMGLPLEPLSDESFDWEPVPEDARSEVAEVLGLIDSFVDGTADAGTLDGAGPEPFGVEYRTACRRYLSRVAAADPDSFRRGRRADHIAAAICWTIGKVNDVVAGPGPGSMRAGELMTRFGLTGSPSTNAMRLASAFGRPDFSAYYPSLGTVDLLTSGRRRRLAESRDRIIARSPSLAKRPTS